MVAWSIRSGNPVDVTLRVAWDWSLNALVADETRKWIAFNWKDEGDAHALDYDASDCFDCWNDRRCGG